MTTTDKKLFMIKLLAVVFLISVAFLSARDRLENKAKKPTPAVKYLTNEGPAFVEWVYADKHLSLELDHISASGFDIVGLSAHDVTNLVITVRKQPIIQRVGDQWEITFK